jgi:methylenetetrahydrofolate--tRNA-(uracil-5-)-methyltransferase
MPIEEMADRGKETLAFGPMRAVGLTDPRSGVQPYAVVQLRQENQEGTLYNLVGFQTKMTYPEQRRVFAMIPGLAKAEFVRLGSLHRNTFINSPKHLLPTLQWRQRSNLFFAGQMTGVEGYIESAATGLLAGINAARLIANKLLVVPPPTTALGGVLRYITDPERKSFQPMNVNFGLLPPLSEPLRKKAKKEMMARRAMADMEAWVRNIEWDEAVVPWDIDTDGLFAVAR